MQRGPAGERSAEIPAEVEILWSPSPEQMEASSLAHYMRWLSRTAGLEFADYNALWAWSVTELDAFWESIWDFFDARSSGSRAPVLASRAMPRAEWYPNVHVNYAENVFRRSSPDRPALMARSEDQPTREVSWATLTRDTGALAARMRSLGIQKGDRVVSYMPNRPETVAAFLACASIGAIWSSCSPDMGATVVLDRYRQIEPKLLFAVDSYAYNGKTHDRENVVAQLLEALPSLSHVIRVRGPAHSTVSPTSQPWRDCTEWSAAISEEAPLAFERVPFEHPLWIVYSSGTTGLPKAIVHGHGGIVLTHLKTMVLQHDVRAGDRLLFLGSAGWIVWNLQLGALLAGATVLLYDGNPGWPDSRSLWHFVDEHQVTLLGCGAAYLVSCMKDGVRPKDFVSLSHLRAINSTGSPLPTQAYRWVYDAVKQDLWLASISGGTDIASGFVACAPILPVTAGEIQCRELGVAAFAFDSQGVAVIDEVGELVVTLPMPSMPLFFWNDEGDVRYRESYFDVYPGVWRHGDWIRFTARGTSVIYGRSDSTINRHGIRMGTAEIYRVVEEIPEIHDSLVVDLEYRGRESFMPLFVVLKPGHVFDDALKARVLDAIGRHASPRHVPNAVMQVDDIPRTLTGKKMEVPIRKLLLGNVGSQAAPGSMANPDSYAYFVRLSQTLNRDSGAAG